MARFLKIDSVKIQNKNIPIALLLGIATLAPRLILFLIAYAKHIDLSNIAYEDASSYIQSAHYIFNKHIFAYDNGLPLQPNSFRTPGYPVFVYIFSAGLYSLKLLSIVQYVFVFVSSLVLYRLSLKLFKEKSIALLTGLLFILEPYYIFWSGLSMSEGLFLPLLILASYYTYQSLISPNTKNIILSGLLFGISSLTRPILLPFFGIVWIVFLLAWLSHQRFGLVTLLKKLLILSFGFVIIVGPWSWRNYRLFGSWNISSVGAYNAVFYDSALLLSRKEHMTWDNAVAILKTMLGQPDTQQIVFTSLIYESQLIAVSTNIAKSHFKDFIILRIENIGAFLLNDGYAHIGRAFGFTIPRIIRLTGIVFWAIQYIAIAYYLFSVKFRSLKNIEKIFIVFVILLIGYFAIVTGAVASARYRVPVMPLIFLLSAPGLYKIYESRRLHLVIRIFFSKLKLS